MFNEAQAEQIIKTRLSNRRFQHSMGVARAAQDLALNHGVDGKEAYLTGVLHDYAKDLTGAQLLAIANEANLIMHPLEKEAPDLLHAPVGAYLLETEMGIKDSEILEAVRVHTLGSINMSRLDKIIFLADMIEPSRDMYPDLERLRKLSRLDLDVAMLLGLESTIRYCIQRRMLLHPRTVEVRNVFLKDILGRESEK